MAYQHAMQDVPQTLLYVGTIAMHEGCGILWVNKPPQGQQEPVACFEDNLPF